MEDTAIIALFEARDEAAIAATEAQYGKLCRSIAEGILGSPQDAEECAQDAYLRLWNAIPPAKPASLSAYLGRIVRNLAINAAEKKRAARRGGEVLPLLAELEECLPPVEEGREIGEVLDRFLGELSAENRRIFLRRYWYCDSTAAIAARFSMKEGAVKVRLHRMRAQLREKLEQEGITP
ncbi:MAG: RNA polymerase sigma factor [Ruminococcaceae bacterium]|nr:RNA polymerase sigma factor [Oscillospiraceae bacterium]